MPPPDLQEPAYGNSPSALSFSSPGDDTSLGGRGDDRRELVARMLEEHKRKKFNVGAGMGADISQSFDAPASGKRITEDYLDYSRDTSSNEITARTAFLKKQQQQQQLTSMPLMPDPSQIYNEEASF